MKNWFRSVSISLFLLAFTLMGVYAQSSPSLTINNILITPRPEQVSYEVNTYLSVLDSAGVPIKDLKADNFSVVEDSKAMAIESIAPANDPMSLAMVLDISGSMTGAAIKSAKDAANSFLLGMGNEDQVSITSFNNTVKPVIDFTKDRQAAGQQLALVDAIPNSGTCLYNAAYQAVQNVAALPPGRRAVVLFTDGVDEGVGGKPCSTFTIDDVIHVATGGNSSIPIYTLGLGYRVDQQSLQRLSTITGGRFQYAPTSDQLGVIFKNLSDQLKTQYVLTYLTTSAQGNHTVVVQATTPGGIAKDTRNFISPAMPAGILIKSPTENQSISGKQVISAVLTGHAEGIQKVVLKVGDKEVDSLPTSPYDFSFEFSSNFSGTTSIELDAVGVNGEIIAKQSINVNVILPTPLAVDTQTTSSTSVATTIITPSATPIIEIGLPIGPQSYLIIGGVVLLIAIVAVIIMIVFRKRKIIGTLEIIFSDDKQSINRTIDIQKPTTRLGKVIEDNDIFFPSDSPVSRHHAILEKKGGDLLISEVPQGTTYGTFVNESKVGKEPILLHNDDEIRLGNRLRLKIKLRNASVDQTIDGIILQEEHPTMDGLPPQKESHDPNATQESVK